MRCVARVIASRPFHHLGVLRGVVAHRDNHCTTHRKWQGVAAHLTRTIGIHTKKAWAYPALGSPTLPIS